MVWGCFSKKGFGNLVRIDGIMDKYKYVNILSNNLAQSAKKLGHKNFIFQQDNDPKHTSGYAKDYFHIKDIKLLNWPSQSPDMNPEENVWGLMKQKTANKIFKNGDELFNELKRIWNDFSKEYAEKLVDSMPKRALALLRAKGGHTKY